MKEITANCLRCGKTMNFWVPKDEDGVRPLCAGCAEEPPVPHPTWSDAAQLDQLCEG